MDKLSPLASPTATRAVLEAHGLTTKYSLGQNFLINDAILQKIVALAEAGPTDRVLEVGPGIGTLTVALLKHVSQVTSVERDPDLPAVLAETLTPWADRFTLVEKDALDLTTADLPYEPTKLVANLPYAVAATVVLDYFEHFPSITSATVMVQKEVADRMAATPGSKNYGAYTVKLRLFAEPAGRFAVGPGNFFPPPRVESAVLRLNRRAAWDDAGTPLSPEEMQATCRMAEAGFANRRKTLSNSCKTYFAARGAEGARIAAELPRLFEQAGIDPTRRGETLNLEEFICLGRALSAFES
ncbi:MULTISPECIES: 16S rRNA (adenine(1518)-N(6)/adenine(1519)-N(6))-dimethyltransferase RsmA [Gordonibacter]|uniref:Ribosomal RNA small subunit methyltransferase A n=1 Tax=Gordonibacter faecis TaxID=3047475 RepID=A0ABT7DJR4_9ACTN|nr:MULTISPECIES: 16S rRNA (adenine(1518)-N(6)/adenine(1519)-N(6))-dimethyltransferase RsmA [unclassified Gordonibacter]MDJ1649766.1 16S rRNA (adenine(1518)-N(6)/adenine(1519)-N(6))-dimethyltransferase RsmA [Gordonibacter sp. KGMB12511]HIW75432.1 16S rRNA (adenine(1518)-N(6)/adenine(1519)-N(6))-dimethyltransferase RsmA [Candidatus Gordonibacter avicola]